MQKIRCITQSEANGSGEYVIFTDDFNSHVGEYQMPDCSIDTDEIINMDIPSGFPLNYQLQRADI
jgi:hypothetical protein